jgi:chromosome segregation ATPase
MVDIVSIEQDFADCRRTRAQLADTCIELRKENEALREANQRQDAERIGVMNQRNQAWEEVERLETELLDASRMTSEQEAEIERLQRQLSACKDIDKELGVLRETVERLRADNARMQKLIESEWGTEP